MPSIIQRLPEALASQIAAGEVVQHPASVVKELMENAIDAGASSIRVFVKDAGKALVQVTDNGSGMSAEDAERCFERHATSKIAAVEDLFAINTMGFRGEALAAIGSVAKVTLNTRPAGEELGRHVQVDGAVVQSSEPAATPEGTSIAVQHLFYNVPARRHFLKSNTAEMRRIVDAFQRIALAHPDVAFSLDHNGLEMYRLPPANTRQRVVALLGKRSNERLVPVEESTPELRIHGFVGKPEAARKTRGDQFFFYNGRFFRSKALHHAVAQAYEGLIPDKQHPLYVLFLEMDPSRVDVNVHPSKEEIKFEDERIVYAYLQAAVRHALSRFSATPTLDFETDPNFLNLDAVKRPGNSEGVEQGQREARQSGRFGQGGDFGGGDFGGGDSGDGRSAASDLGAEPAAKPSRTGAPLPISDRLTGERRSGGGYPALPKAPASGSPASRSPASMQKDAQGRQPWEALFEVLEDERKGDAESEAYAPQDGGGPSGVDEPQALWDAEDKVSTDAEIVQLHRRYLLCPVKSGFLLVDQRIAHERVLFEKYRHRLAEGAGASQRELFPARLELGPADAATLRELLPAFQALGFDIAPETDGSDHFLVHGTPADCAEMDGRLAVDELLEHFRRLEEVKELGPRDRVARSLARSYAIPYGKALSPEACRALIDALFACQAPYAGPAGNPTFLTFNNTELAQRFYRKQA